MGGGRRGDIGEKTGGRNSGKFGRDKRGEKVVGGGRREAAS